MRRVLLLATVGSMMFACAPAIDSLPPPAANYPEANGLGEAMQADEARIAAAITNAIIKGLKKRAVGRKGKDRPFVRDAHPKAHGCVKANFEVEPDLPPSLARGVFQPGTSYCSWVRFSNADENPDRADTERDGRGMAIKLLNVKGPTLLEAHKDAGTQDFIMISHPVFFIDDARRYLSVIERVNGESKGDKLSIPLILGIQGTWNAFWTTWLRSANPLEVRYWSMTPYQLGIGESAKAIKFKAQPCGYDALSDQRKDALGAPNIPDNAAPNFLRQSLNVALRTGTPCMEFLTQPRKPTMSVENSKTEWKAEASFWDKIFNRDIAPFKKVATLRFLKEQDFDTKVQNNFCEDMAFTPWHALREHRPLGAVNRMRKVIYRDVSRFRRANNLAPQQEPPAYHLEQCVQGRWQSKSAK